MPRQTLPSKHALEQQRQQAFFAPLQLVRPRCLRLSEFFRCLPNWDTYVMQHLRSDRAFAPPVPNRKEDHLQQEEPSLVARSIHPGEGPLTFWNTYVTGLATRHLLRCVSAVTLRIIVSPALNERDGTTTFGTLRGPSPSQFCWYQSQYAPRGQPFHAATSPKTLSIRLRTKSVTAFSRD